MATQRFHKRMPGEYATAELENCSPLAQGGNFLNSIFLGQDGTSDSFRGVMRAVR